MRGLLDLADDPGSQGLLSLGLRLMSTPGKFSTALGTAGLGAMGDLNSATQAKQRRDLLAQEEKSRAFQMLMQQQQMQQIIEQQARQKAIEGAYTGAIRSPDQQAMAANGGPTVAAANAAPGMMPGIDQQALIQGLLKAGAGQEAYQMLQPKPKKLSRLEPMRGRDGQMVNVAVYEDGTTSILPFGVRPDIVLQGLGDRVTAIDKNATQGGASFAMGQSPDSRANNAVQMRGQNMTADAAAQRLAADQGTAIADAGGPGQAELVKRLGKPPKDYRWKADGNAEPIPGGPADIKSGVEGAKAEQKKASTIAQSNSVLDTVNDAKNLVGMNTAGVGSWLSALPATDARNLAAKLETVKSNLGFDRLQQMRDQSPTGGALGAVAVQELTALQSTVASLDQAQSPGELKAALTKIEGHYKRWLDVMGAPRQTPKFDNGLTPKEAAELEELRKSVGMK